MLVLEQGWGWVFLFNRQNLLSLTKVICHVSGPIYIHFVCIYHAVTICQYYMAWIVNL